MALPIFYINQPLNVDFITLNEETSKHVVQVLRMKRGDKLQLTDGKGSLIKAAIEEDHKKQCSVRVIDSLVKNKNERSVAIGISLLKNATRFEWFLEKATEIGITEIFPLRCERTEKQHFRFDRMNNILIAAMLQSQQCYLPVLHEPVLFKDLIHSSNWQTKLIAHCTEEPKEALSDFKSATSVQLLIGPEGDFTATEIELALKNGFMPVTLGTTRLRTETAGVAGAALLCI